MTIIEGNIFGPFVKIDNKFQKGLRFTEGTLFFEVMTK